MRSAVLALVVGLLLSGCGSTTETVIVVTATPKPVAIRIAGMNMEPTYHPGQMVTVDKHAYDQNGPKRGDVVLYYPPVSAPVGTVFVGRIIGLPGETVAVRNHAVYINHARLAESWRTLPPDYDWGPETAPMDSYFILGDNRENSADSHQWPTTPWLSWRRVAGKVTS